MGELTKITLQLLVSFCGGGFIVGLLNWARANQADKRTIRVQTIRNQLEKLYGPLYFFTSQNEECLKLCQGLDKALDSDKVHVIDGEGRRQSMLRDEEVDATINLSNDYVGIVNRNNEQVMEIFRSNWQHVDSRDIEIFRQMMVDYLRHKTEFVPGKKMRIPTRISHLLGNIFFMRPEFIERIRQRVKEKQGELQRLAR